MILDIQIFHFFFTTLMEIVFYNDVSIRSLHTAYEFNVFSFILLTISVAASH